MRGIYLFFVLATTVVLFSFNSLHPTGNTNAPGDSFCANCHGGSGGPIDGQVTVTGLPGTIMPSTTYQLTITSSNPTLNASKAGFQILVLDELDENAGTMTNNSGGTAFRTNTSNGRVYLGHNPAESFGGNADITWTTDWTSPATGNTITVYAASVIANGNGGNSGDLAVFSTASAPMSGGGTPLTVMVTEDNPTLCFDSNDGIATATPMGGIMPYTYAWDNGETNAQAVALSPGLHEVTVTDNASNNIIGDVFINSPTEVVASIGSQENVSCFEGNDGFAVAQAIGGTPGYNYQWSDGGSGAMRTDLVTGTYQVTATDINNCEDVTAVFIDEPQEITATETIGELSCNNATDGSISIIPNGGTGNYMYEWNTGSADQNLMNIGAGLYTLTITDDNQCQKIFQYELQNPASLNLTVESTLDALCNGEATGEAEVSAQGGTGNLSYQWSDSGTGAIRTDLLAGQYIVSVVDQNDCEVSDVVEINEPDALMVDSIDAVEASCNGVMDGALEVSAQGGSGTISFLWSNNATTARVENIQAGTYTVTVTDNNNCTMVRSLTLGAKAGATLSEGNSMMVSCNGGIDGSAMVSILDGDGYTITWSNGTEGLMISNLAAGTYTATANNTSGCQTNEVVITIMEPSAITIDSTEISNPLCTGDDNGSLLVNSGGGTGQLSYLWDNGDTTNMLTGIAAGQYIVDIVDQNNCTISDTLTLVDPPAVAIDSAMVVSLLCFGDSTGIISVSTSGGTGGLSFSWDNGDTTSEITDLIKGDYNVVVSDANDCMVQERYTISEPDQIIVSASIVNESAQGLSDGSIKIVVTGGTEGYMYLWSNGEMTDSIGGLSPGNYDVTITDANGCEEQFSYPISDGSCALKGTAESTDVSCFGLADGTVLINTENALGDVTYSSSPFISNLDSVAAGTYEIIISDTAGCNVVISDIVITEPPLLVVAVDEITPSDGFDNGKIEVTPDGGTQPYSFDWINEDGSSVSDVEDAENLPPGLYSLVLTDSNGCTATQDSLEVTLNSSTLDYTNTIKVYPNPVLDQLNIGATKAIKEFRIINTHGRVISNVKGRFTEKSIDVSNWTEGVYLVQLLTDKSWVSKKIVIMH